MARILGIESTCDETAAAVVQDGTRVLSSVIASQIELHARYRGVVPEIACRAHIEHILPVIHDAIAQAGLASAAEIDAIAVAHRPGLIGCLLIGVTAAKTLAWALGKPLIAVDHVQAHLYSVMLHSAAESAGLAGAPIATPFYPTETAGASPFVADRHRAVAASRPAAPESAKSAGSGTAPQFPAVGLAISGGHTALYRLNSFADIHRLGSTIDDAIGEAYDKVSFILGLGYPGGPIIDKLAGQGDPAAIRFPRSTLSPTSLDFSFSGLKTSVLYHVRGFKGKERSASDLSAQQIADVAAGFQAACISVVLTKLKRAIAAVNARSVIIGGGVSANSGLRGAVGKLGVPCHFPNLRYCTDNAAMSAGLGYLKFQNRDFAPLDLDAVAHSLFAHGNA